VACVAARLRLRQYGISTIVVVSSVLVGASAGPLSIVVSWDVAGVPADGAASGAVAPPARRGPRVRYRLHRAGHLRTPRPSGPGIIGVR
jgi:hypothetical protein